MSEPTPLVRAVTYERDEHRCVSCGATVRLQYQHRLAVGMGGSKIRPRLEEGLTSCAICNPEYERTLQLLALRYGWKVKKVKAAREHPEDVPVFYIRERQWCVLSTSGSRRRVAEAEALRMMRAVYGPEYEEWEKAA